MLEEEPGGGGRRDDAFRLSFGLVWKLHEGHPGRCMRWGPEQRSGPGPPAPKITANIDWPLGLCWALCRRFRGVNPFGPHNGTGTWLLSVSPRCRAARGPASQAHAGKSENLRANSLVRPRPSSLGVSGSISPLQLQCPLCSNHFQSLQSAHTAPLFASRESSWAQGGQQCSPQERGGVSLGAGLRDPQEKPSHARRRAGSLTSGSKGSRKGLPPGC